MTPERHWLGRFMLSDPRQVEVTPPTHPARLSGGHGRACSLDRDHVHGKLEDRYKVWLMRDLPCKLPQLHTTVHIVLHPLHLHLYVPGTTSVQVLLTILHFFSSLPGTVSVTAPYPRGPFDHTPSFIGFLSFPPSSTAEDCQVLPDPQAKVGLLQPPPSPLLLEAVEAKSLFYTSDQVCVVIDWSVP